MRALQSLSELLDGDVGAWNDLLRTHLGASARLVEQIEGAVGGPDWEILERSAHTLKSSSALFGALDLSSACSAVESAARRKEPDAALHMARDLLDRAREAERALVEWLDRVP